jgi:DNA mismatch repair endonuclease MutH
LVSDLREVEGIPFAELESATGDSSAAGNKAAGRAVLDRYTRRCTEVQESFGVSVRTLPVGPTGKVLWPTKIVGIDLPATMRDPFERSRVARMLEAVLFVPINKPDAREVGGWSFSVPVIWVPAGGEREQLRDDYEAIRNLVRAGRADELSSSSTHGQGRWLMPKTSGANSKDIVTYLCAGNVVEVRRRAFFLREVLTARVLAETTTESKEYARVDDDPPAAGIDLDVTLENLLRDQRPTR